VCHFAFRHITSDIRAGLTFEQIVKPGCREREVVEMVMLFKPSTARGEKNTIQEAQDKHMHNPLPGKPAPKIYFLLPWPI
jgi:hypothetical protein